MELGPKTKIDDLLTRYPFMLEYFVSKSPKFKLLKNPVSRRTLGKIATMSQVASIGGMDLDELLGDIAVAIREQTGEEVAVSGGDDEVEALAPEEREARQEVLKSIIKDLHDGADMTSVKQRFLELIRDIDASEIAAMEQALIEEGMPETEVKRLCDVHVEVFKESLEAQPAPEMPAGHPVNTFMLENQTTEAITGEIKGLLDEAGGRDDFLLERRDDLARLVDRLAEIDLHYLRKENQLFPILEGYHIEGPSQVMWALHDDIRGAIKTARAELTDGKVSAAANTLRYVMQSVIDMIYKEEHILYPMALETLTADDWLKVRRGEEEIGYSWVTPSGVWPTVEEAPGQTVGAAPEELSLTIGHLTPEQMDLVLLHLPIELSFVDENDEVCYYTGLEHKIFPRSPGVIGRRVQNCHPRSSLDKVQRILEQFRTGEKDEAEFWIDAKGGFIHIRYFAVRDAEGNYRGTLETVQEISGIRKLTGEQRLLDWD
ncbi:MAG: DUF438 domain-containing protein [Thermoleophilia bacterium]